MEINKKYKVNWDVIKWKYRIAKGVFIFGFLYLGNYYFVKQIINKKEIHDEMEYIKKRLTELSIITNEKTKPENTVMKYIDELSKQIKSFHIEINPLINDKLIENNINEKLIYLILKYLSENLVSASKSENTINTDIKSMLRLVTVSGKRTNKSKEKNYAEMKSE